MRAVPFVPPAWAAHLKHVPKTRLVLMQEQATPVQPWTFSAGPDGPFSLLIKRDDMTDVAASGNKIRKLEFLLAEAREEGADALISVGGERKERARGC
jgi:D-cysteine desulfhydrase